MILKKFILTNLEIYNWVINLTNYFTQDMQLQCSAIDNFIISSNYYKLFNIAKNIESSKQLIGRKYGKFSSAKNGYIITDDLMSPAEDELYELMNMSVEIELFLLPLSHIENMQLSIGQMQALVPMINMNEEKEVPNYGTA